MEDYFYGPSFNYNYPSPPIYPTHEDYYLQPQPFLYKNKNNNTPKPKRVVSIPVPNPKYKITIKSNNNKRETCAAVRIQKVFRGYRVRKNMKTILDISKYDMQDVARDVVRMTVMESLRKDERFRIGVSERVMGLLIKLDSVKGVNDVVRDCRKRVVKKALLLQEKIDRIVAQEEEKERELMVKGVADMALDDDVVGFGGKGEIFEEKERNADVGFGEKDFIFGGSHIADVVFGEKGEVFEAKENAEVGVGEKGEIFGGAQVKSLEGSLESGAHMDIPVSSAGKGGNFGGDNMKDCSLVADVEEEKGEWECVEEEDGVAAWCMVGGKKEKEERRKSRSKEKKKVLEKIAQDNERLLKLVEDLCEKNAKQASLITSLTQRVQELEKGVCEERLRKRKSTPPPTTQSFPKSNPNLDRMMMRMGWNNNHAGFL